MKHLFLPALVSLLVFSVFGQTGAETPAANSGMISIAGEKFGPEELNGKIVVLNFWYTSCPPCLKEIPELNKLVSEFKEKDVVFLALAIDDEKSLQSFLKENPFDYQIIPSALGLMVKFFEPDASGNLEAKFPTHIVVDRERRKTVFETGLKGVEDVRAELTRQYMVEKAPKPDSDN